MADLLDLNTVIERPTITIDNKPYDLLAPEEMSIVQGQKVAMLGRKLDKLMKSESSDPATENSLNKVLQDIIEIIMQHVPKTVQAKLSDAQQLAVIDVFTMLLLARKAKLAGGQALTTTMGDTIQKLIKTVTDAGAASSQDASASTAEPLGDG